MDTRRAANQHVCIELEVAGRPLFLCLECALTFPSPPGGMCFPEDNLVPTVFIMAHLSAHPERTVILDGAGGEHPIIGLAWRMWKEGQS